MAPRWDSAAAVNALVVEPVDQGVSEVAFVFGSLAKPNPCKTFNVRFDYIPGFWDGAGAGGMTRTSANVEQRINDQLGERIAGLVP